MTIIYVVYKRHGDFSTRSTFIEMPMPKTRSEMQALVQSLNRVHNYTNADGVDIISIIELEGQ